MYDEELEGFEEGASEEALLPEDEEAVLRAVEITKEILSSPRNARPDHLYYAIDCWEGLSHGAGDHLSDLVGEIVELLGEVLKRRHITFEESRRGKQIAGSIAKYYGIAGRWDSSWED